MPAFGQFIFFDSSKPSGMGVHFSYIGLVRELEKIHGSIKYKCHVNEYYYIYGYETNAQFRFEDNAEVIIWKSTVNEGAVFFDNNQNRISDGCNHDLDHHPDVLEFNFGGGPITFSNEDQITVIHWTRAEIDPTSQCLQNMYPEFYHPVKKEPKIVPLAGYIKEMKMYSDPECTKLLYELHG